MNTENVINSIYNPKRKSRDAVFFPKICKQESTPPEHNSFVRGASRKYNQPNIFKAEDEKRQQAKWHVEEERRKDLRSRECQELELKISEMLKEHQEQLTQLEQNQKRVGTQIEQSKQSHYQIKLNIWELKNEIMDLNGMLLEEEAELKRLQAIVAQQGQYEQLDDYEDQNEGMFIEAEPEEAEEEAPNDEQPEETSSMNILHNLSQEEEAHFDPQI